MFAFDEDYLRCDTSFERVILPERSVLRGKMSCSPPVRIILYPPSRYLVRSPVCGDPLVVMDAARSIWCRGDVTRAGLTFPVSRVARHLKQVQN